MTRLVMLACLVLLSGCGGTATNERPISKTDLRDQWPFTFDAGVLACEPGNHVTVKANGQVYAINGSAKGAAARNGYADSNPIVSRRPLSQTRNRVDRITEAERQRLFAALVGCEDRAADEAIIRCKAQLRTGEAITEREVSLISEEGINAGWPPMAPFLADVSDVIRLGLELCK